MNHDEYAGTKVTKLGIAAAIHVSTIQNNL